MVATVSDIDVLQAKISAWRAAGEKIGFVPTMGYLHTGHLSLIAMAKAENDHCVVSIFVNPTQFGPTEDFERYPRDEQGDLEKSASAGADLVFFPTVKALYPEGYVTYVTVENFSSILCGSSRPTHFRGVTTIVNKLFNIVQPHRAYFGQKDAQQAFIIKTMVRDLNMNLEVVIMPTVREPDGLAMSSRNAYLSSEQRVAATVLYRALLHGEKLVRQGERDAGRVRHGIEQIIDGEPLAKIDYVALVDPDTFAEPGPHSQQLLAALAVFVGRTRLIDNMTYDLDIS